VMAIPAEAAAAAAATAPAVDDTTASKVVDVANKRLNMQEALTEKVQFFGRVKAARKAAASSSSSGQGSSQPQQQRPPQQQQPSKQEVEQQLDKLLAAVQDWKAGLTSSSSSSSGSSARILPAAFRLTPREQEAAELAAEFLELVKASAAAKAAAAVATKSKYIAKSAGLPSSKLVSGLESLLLQLNKDPQRRLFLLHIATDDSSSSSNSSGSRGDGSSSEEDESSSDEDEDESTPGSVQAMMKAKARTAAEGVRQREAARAVRAESAAADEQQLQRLDEAVGSGLSEEWGTPSWLMGNRQAKQQERADVAGGSSSSEKGRQTNGDTRIGADSDSGEKEGMTLIELIKIIKQHQKELATPDGQQSDFALYLKASKGAFKVAATIPTAQDRVAEVLLLTFSLLEQLAMAGAFVASSGNLAASFTAAAAVQVATTTLQQAVGQRERQRIREGIGRGWALQLNLLQQE